MLVRGNRATCWSDKCHGDNFASRKRILRCDCDRIERSGRVIGQFDLSLRRLMSEETDQARREGPGLGLEWE